MRVVLVVVLIASVAVASPAAAGGNEAPMAEAGLDQQVTVDTTVVLDAGGSYDPDGDVDGYEWSIRTPDGRVVTPAAPGAVRTTFVPDRTGRYVVTLTITDDDGATATDTTYVDVAPDDTGGPDGSENGSGANAGDGSSSDGESGAGESGQGSKSDPGDGTDGTDSGDANGSSTDGEGAADGDADSPTGGNGSDDGSDAGAEAPPADGDGPETSPGNGSDTGPDGPEGPEGPDGGSDPGEPAGGSDDPDDGTPSGGENAPPWATIDGPASLAPGEQATYTASAGDFDGRVRSVEWSSGGSGPDVVRTAPSDGSLTVSATVVDDDGAATVVTRTVRVVPGLPDANRPPSVELSTPGPVRVGGNLRVGVTASDPDGEVVDLAVAPAREFDLAGPRTYTVRVTATDDDGATATDTLRVAPVQLPAGPATGLPGWATGRPDDPL